MIVSICFEDILLSEHDFPDHFANFAHPDDYIINSKEIKPEFICHSKLGCHNRLIYRVSFGRGSHFFSVSFVCDTGAPGFLYLSPQAIQLLERLEAVNVDDDTGLAWLAVDGKKIPINPTPECHSPANKIGLKLLHRLGLCLDENSFGFSNAPKYFQLQ